MSVYDHRDYDDGFNRVASVTLADGQRAEVTFSPSDRTSKYFLSMVAVSKKTGSTYKVELDDRSEFPEAAIPPTDVDDAVDTFTPPETFERECKVVIKNTSGSSKTYRVQISGWERRQFADESEEVPW